MLRLSRMFCLFGGFCLYVVGDKEKVSGYKRLYLYKLIQKSYLEYFLYYL